MFVKSDASPMPYGMELLSKLSTFQPHKYSTLNEEYLHKDFEPHRFVIY